MLPVTIGALGMSPLVRLPRLLRLLVRLQHLLRLRLLHHGLQSLQMCPTHTLRANDEHLPATGLRQTTTQNQHAEADIDGECSYSVGLRIVAFHC